MAIESTERTKNVIIPETAYFPFLGFRICFLFANFLK